MSYKPVTNQLRIYHIPQVGQKGVFYIEVANEEEAFRLINALALQHLWLFENGYIPDYANATGCQMWTLEGEEGPEWMDYYNEQEEMEFDELCETYFDRGKFNRQLQGSITYTIDPIKK